jgi:hypothetical protein
MFGIYLESQAHTSAERWLGLPLIFLMQVNTKKTQAVFLPLFNISLE